MQPITKTHVRPPEAAATAPNAVTPAATVAPGSEQSALDASLARGASALAALQHTDGYWSGELEADVSLNAEYIFFLHYMGYAEPETRRRLIAYVKRMQRADGSWAIHPGAKGSLSITIEAYAAAKLAGVGANEPWLVRAREFVLARGGIMTSRILTKIYLALIGEFSWDGVPAMPVSFMLLPRGQPFNLYEVACWARSYTVPLLVLNTQRISVPVPEGRGVRELYTTAPEAIKNWEYEAKPDGFFTWENFFLQTDRVLRLIAKYLPAKLALTRKRALKRAEEWVLEHQDQSGDWGGIFPAMINSLMALRMLGYPLEHDAIVRGKRALERLHIADPGQASGTGEPELRQQPCASPVWDTAWAALALEESARVLEGGGRASANGDGAACGNGSSTGNGVLAASGDERCLPASRARMAACAGTRWLAPRQIREPGDWSIKAPWVEPGGWCFQFDNRWYPDLDDTAVVLIALRTLRESLASGETPAERQARIDRGVAWLLGLQNPDGGWGAFERAVPGNMLEYVPYNDCDNLGDPSTPDLTGRVLEALGRLGAEPSYRAVVAGCGYLEQTQRTDGSWFGRWGVNHIYGTWSVLAALGALGLCETPMAQAAADWLQRTQLADGGWGEACESYTSARYHELGESTASQTAWGLLGLVASGRAQGEPAERAAAYLVRTQLEAPAGAGVAQTPAGLWAEDWYTGTGFPGHFYLKYHMYPKYFPVLALARYATARGA